MASDVKMDYNLRVNLVHHEFELSLIEKKNVIFYVDYRLT